MRTEPEQRGQGVAMGVIWVRGLGRRCRVACEQRYIRIHSLSTSGRAVALVRATNDGCVQCVAVGPLWRLLSGYAARDR